jgi:hypothetical protein
MNRRSHNIGEHRIREAMAIPGRFKPDGCWLPVRTSAKIDDTGVLTVHKQVNRKFYRSLGRAS